VRVLVTGANGMLGRDLSRELGAHGHSVCATGSAEMDVRQPDQVRRTFADFQPEQVFHLAALTDVDGCERTPEAAYHTNVLGTQLIALACAAADVPMVYVSTIAVFDGLKPEAYIEFDTPNPQSCYARSKYEGEKVVQQHVPRHFILRAGWMFGGGAADKKFVARILHQARTQRELKAVDDKFGSPTYTVDMARAVVALAHSDLYGLYHLVNVGQPVSRFQIAQKALEYAGLTDCRVIPVSSAAFPLAAPRPRMEAARNLHAELFGLDLMRPWEAALREYVTSLPA
jgi:dTDP-4-dehydrorhamnose reductase